MAGIRFFVPRPYVSNEIYSPNETATKREPPHWYASPEWWLFILGVPSLFVIAWQARATAAAARATEELVESGRDTARRQLRAYLAVTIGEATYQERDKNLCLRDGHSWLIQAKPLRTRCIQGQGCNPSHPPKQI